MTPPKKIKRVRRRGNWTPRPYRFRFSNPIARAASDLFRLAEEVMKVCGGLDTAMRDISHDGLARIIYVAYDTASQNINWEASGDKRYEEQQQWIETSVAGWFREREFAEWYCLGAAHCFDRVPPRTRADIDARIFRVPGTKKKKVAA